MKASNILYTILAAALLVSCSMTKGIPEDDQLFTGLTKIAYASEPKLQDETYSKHLATTKEELEAALATQPNGSLFGSSYYTVPWSWHLWVYNKYSGKESGFAKWMVKSFGKPPVLMSKVNPALRASVARSVLQNNGFFRGNVTYETIPQKNPKKCKIGYTVEFDSLYTLDSVSYVNFPAPMQSLIDSTSSERLIKSGAPFSIANLDGERTRISNLMRNNGYFYYNTSYASYLADTFAIDGKAQLRFQLASGLPDEVSRKWYIGNINVNFRKTAREQLNDSIHRRHLTIHYNGKKSPIRPGVVLKDLRLRPRQEYSYERYLESTSLINSNGVFRSTDFQFTPRPDSDTLDLQLNCVFDKPYDFYIEGNMIGRTSGRYGPQAKVGFTKRNAFRAGEKLDINLHGSYEFSTSGGSDASNYQYGIDASLEFPRLLIPFYNPQTIRRNRNGRPVRPRRFYTASTLAKVSADVVRRPEYYKMHIVGGEWTYRWQRTETSRHEFSPLTVKYQFMNSRTLKFDSIVKKNPYLERTMGDFFIPKMRYTYTYTSPKTLQHPIRWETTRQHRVARRCSLWPFLQREGEEALHESLCPVRATGDRLHQDLVGGHPVQPGGTYQFRHHVLLRQQQRSPLQRGVLCRRCQQRPSLRYPRDRTRQFRSVISQQYFQGRPSDRLPPAQRRLEDRGQSGVSHATLRQPQGCPLHRHG